MSFTLLRSAQQQPSPIGYIDGKGFRPHEHPHYGLKPDAATVSRLMGVAKAIQQTLAKMEGK